MLDVTAFEDNLQKRTQKNGAIRLSGRAGVGDNHPDAGGDLNLLWAHPGAILRLTTGKPVPEKISVAAPILLGLVKKTRNFGARWCVS